MIQLMSIFTCQDFRVCSSSHYEDMYFESELPDFFKAKLDELRNEMN